MAFKDEVRATIEKLESAAVVPDAARDAYLNLRSEALKTYEGELKDLWVLVQDTWGEEIGMTSRCLRDFAIHGGEVEMSGQDDLVPFPIGPYQSFKAGEREREETETVEGLVIDNHFIFCKPGELRECIPTIFRESSDEQYLFDLRTVLVSTDISLNVYMSNKRIRKRSVPAEDTPVNSEDPRATEFEFARFVGPPEAKILDETAGATIAIRCSVDGAAAVYSKISSGEWTRIATLREMLTESLGSAIFDHRRPK